MNGYGSHTFKNVNESGEAVYVKYHFKTDQGVRNLDAATAAQLATDDPDYAIRDLYNAIANGDFPSWTMYVQVMTYEQTKNAPFNPFDLTKIWSHRDFPLQEVGRICLNRNPENYFADVEQLAFSPSHLVPGIEPSPDKMLQARLFSYPDTHRHRLGANYQHLPCNAGPYGPANNNYQRDGPMQTTRNGAGAPNYYPNSFRGPEPSPTGQWHSDTVSGQVGRVETGHEDNFCQCGEFFRKVLSPAERERLTDNIARHLSDAQPFIRKRVISNFALADPEYGSMVADKVDRIVRQPKPSRTSRPAAPLNPPRSAPRAYAPTQAAGCPYGYSSKL
jgi:catalase